MDLPPFNHDQHPLSLVSAALRSYRSRSKTMIRSDPFSIEVEMDDEDQSTLQPILDKYEWAYFDQRVVQAMRSELDTVLGSLYNLGHHLYRVFVNRIWYDEALGEIQVRYACLEEPKAIWNDKEWSGLNDADRLASILMKRDPPDLHSVREYEGPDGLPCIQDIFASFEDSHLRLQRWGGRPYRGPLLNPEAFPRGRSEDLPQVISAILFDQIAWKRLLSFDARYKKLMNEQSGLGFIHGMPMFRVTPGSGWIPSGSLIIVTTDDPLTLRGQPQNIHQNLITGDAHICHYYDYWRAMHVGFQLSRIQV